MAVNQQTQGAEGSGSRHRRRREHGNSGNQPSVGANLQSPDLANQKGAGGRHGSSANKIDRTIADNAGQQQHMQQHSGHYSGHNSNGYGYNAAADGGGRGGGGRWGGTRYGAAGHHNGEHGGGYGYGYGGDGRSSDELQGGGRGGYQQQHQQHQAPWGPAPEEHSLKDLLLQVAPQARIAENTSRLSSKASANILSKCLGAAATTSQPEWMNEDPGNEWSWAEQASWGGGGAASSADNSMPDYGGGGGYGANGMQAKHAEDDEESAFMERWSGLFSKSSPLVDGSCQDPFQDMKSRAKVVWKSNRDRAGHRQRYQQRKLEKERQEKDDGEGDGGQAGAGEEAGGGASVVYDAYAPQAQWHPDRPPANF